MLIGDLLIKPNAKILMMGTPEEATAALDAQADVAPHVQDDFNTAEGVLDDVAFVDREENQVNKQTELLATVVPEVSSVLILLSLEEDQAR